MCLYLKLCEHIQTIKVIFCIINLANLNKFGTYHGGGGELMVRGGQTQIDNFNRNLWSLTIENKNKTFDNIPNFSNLHIEVTAMMKKKSTIIKGISNIREKVTICWKRRIFPGDSIPMLLAGSRRFLMYSHKGLFVNCFQKVLTFYHVYIMYIISQSLPSYFRIDILPPCIPTLLTEPFANSW